MKEALINCLYYLITTNYPQLFIFLTSFKVIHIPRLATRAQWLTHPQVIELPLKKHDLIARMLLCFSYFVYLLANFTFWHAYHTDIFAVYTVCHSPSCVSTLGYRSLSSSTINVIHPYNPCSFSKLCITKSFQCSLESQLAT